MNKCSEVALILPAKDEASRLEGQPYENCLSTYGDFFRGAFGKSFYGLVVNDGSSDKTEQLAKEHGWEVVSHPYNMGKGAAIRTGVKEVISKASQDPRLIIAVADSDGQYSAETVGELVDMVKKGADIAVAKRAESCSTKNWRKLAHVGARWIVACLTNTGVSDTQAGAMAFNRKAADIWVNKSSIDGYAATTEFLHIASRDGLKAKEKSTQITEVGESHVKFFDAFEFAFDAARIILTK